MTIGESSERAQNAAQACADLQAAAPAGAKAASKAHMRSLTQRVFSTFLAVALAVSMTPSVALAETQTSVSPVVQNEAQKADAPDAGQVAPAPDFRNRQKPHHRRPLLRGPQPNPVTMTRQPTLPPVALLRMPKRSTMTLMRPVLLTMICKRMPLSPLSRRLSKMFPRQLQRRPLKKRRLL